ncbi:hypothetical protein [Comamonas aquatica]|uniref:Uncharacterized protein n=1 Tax=Comamonas aquatica TaxID=225991 RepID=A0AA42HY90_9BURK|nr:hypothetical protein [Comamonas aquatica]MDH0365151.1 hypothetical protein [Comamonas aquatica]
MFHHKLLHLLVLSWLTVSMLLSSLGLFQSHGMAQLVAAQAGFANVESHADHTHDEEERFAETTAAANHAHDADGGQHDHNPLDHSHETQHVPPMLAVRPQPDGHHLVAAPAVRLSDHEPWRLERPPMHTITL